MSLVPFLPTCLTVCLMAQAFRFWFLAALVTTRRPTGVMAILSELLAQLLDSWRRTSVAFISSIRDGDWVGQMQLDDARTILEALAQIGTDRDIGNAAALCFSRIAAIRRVSIRVASVEEHDSILAELENTSDSLEFADRERSHAILRDRLNSNRLWTWT